MFLRIILITISFFFLSCEPEPSPDSLVDNFGKGTYILTDNGLSFIKKNTDIYQIYKEIYFNSFNFIKHHFDKKKLNKKNFQKLKNDNITVMQAIKTKLSNSYIYIDQEKNFKTI